MARLAFLCLTGALGQWGGGYSTGYSSAPSYGGYSWGYSSAPSYGGYSTGYRSAPSYGGYSAPSWTSWSAPSWTSWSAPQPRYIAPRPRPQARPRPPPRPMPQPRPVYKPYTPPPQEDDGGYFTHTIISDKTLLSKPTITRGFKYLGAKTRHWVGKTETRHHQDSQYLGTVKTRQVGEWGPTKEKSRVSKWKQISDTGYGPGQLIKRAGASKNKDPTFGGFSDNIGWTIRTGPAQAQQAAYEAPMPVYQAESAPIYGGYQEAQPVEEYSAPEPAYGGGY